MLYSKIIKEIELQKKLNEDSLVSAYASLKYADKMLANAHEKGLESKKYWSDKKSHATERINVLKGKGEEETEDTHKQANELLSKLENKNKESFKELLKNPEVRKHAITFVKDMASHVSMKAMISHTAHHFHNLIKPVIDTTKGLFTKPKETYVQLKSTSKEYFFTVFKTMKNTKVIAQNANQAVKDIHSKYKTRFSEEEKKDLLSDPDKFLSKLSNKLSPSEIKDIKMVTRHALNVATAALCAQYISHVTHGITEVGHALTDGLTKASIEVCKEVGKEHLAGAMKESFINTSVLALNLAENTTQMAESNMNENEDYSNLFASMIPFIKLYSTKPEIQKSIIQEIVKNIE